MNTQMRGHLILAFEFLSANLAWMDLFFEVESNVSIIALVALDIFPTDLALQAKRYIEFVMLS